MIEFDGELMVCLFGSAESQEGWQMISSKRKHPPRTMSTAKHPTIKDHQGIQKGYPESKLFPTKCHQTLWL